MERFADIVEAAGQLPVDDQLALVEILRNRLAHQQREAIISDVQTARKEFAESHMTAKKACEIMDEISDES